MATASVSSKETFFRADKIDFKSWDMQLEKHLIRVWSKDREVPAPREEWEIDLAKLDIRHVVAHGTYGTVYRGLYDAQDVAAKEAYDAAEVSAAMVAACVCEQEHSFLKESPPGTHKLLSIWYSHPPFRVHHFAERSMDLEWESMYDSNDSKLLPISISYQADGNYLVKVGGNSSTVFEVKATFLGDHDYRVEVVGVGINVALAVYSKDRTKHIHLWRGSQHHHFRQQLGFELGEEEEMQHNASSETTSHPPRIVVAPMAGRVVKVLANNEMKVEGGQPVLVLVAMKMEHVVKAPSAGYVHGLELAAGQQVSDGSILFRIKDE